MKTVFLPILLLPLLLNNCASKTAEAPPTTTAGSDATVLNANACDATSTTTATTSTANQIAGDQLYLNIAGQRSSLCNTLSQSGKNILVVFITSPTCLSCVPKLKSLGQYVSTDNSVHLITAVPNRVTSFIKDYSTQEINSFVSGIITNTTPAYDENGVMWKKFSANPSLPLFPIAIIMNKNKEAAIISTAQLEGSNVVETYFKPAIARLK